MEGSERVICVDLDGTLINTDLSVDAAKKIVRKNVLNIFRLVFWYLKGIQYLKYRVSEEVQLDPSVLPYNFSFLSYITLKKSEGCKIYCRHLYCFAGYISQGERVSIADCVISRHGNGRWRYGNFMWTLI